MMKRLIAYSCMAIFAMGSMAQNQKDEAQMNRFISGLMKKMTLEEKVGQLSQCSGGFATGPDNTRISRTEDISKGLIGSLLNVSGAANTRKYQEAAMKSRLQIPLLFGLDVIHGYRTGFPLPLAEAASFDLDAIERGSRCAAKEAAAAGLHWTFAPMVDISWDARWGRVMEGAGEDPYYGSLVAKARVHGYREMIYRKRILFYPVLSTLPDMVQLLPEKIIIVWICRWDSLSISICLLTRLVQRPVLLLS